MCCLWKGRITSFGEQDEIGLHRFPCLASYGSFQFLQQQALEMSASQMRPFKATYVGQDQLQKLLPYSFWHTQQQQILKALHREPHPKGKGLQKEGGFIRVVICSDLLQTLSLTVHCLQASNCSLSTSQPCRYTVEGSATMLPLPRVLPAQLPGVGKDSETQGSLTESAAIAEATWR